MLLLIFVEFLRESTHGINTIILTAVELLHIAASLLASLSGELSKHLWVVIGGLAMNIRLLLVSGPLFISVG